MAAMHVAWEEFRNAGWIAFVILLVGAAAIPATIAAVAMAASGSKNARYAGIAAVVLGSMCAGLGATGVLLGRRMTEGAVAGESISPVMKERIRRMGYLESRSAARVGLFFATLPLLAGAAAIGVGMMRARSGGAKPPAPAPAPFGRPGSGPFDPPGNGPFGPPGGALIGPGGASEPAAAEGLALPAGVLVMGLASAGAAFTLLKTPLPGRDLDPNDSTWSLLEAIETIDRGDLAQGCKDLEDAFGHAMVPPDGEPLYADPAKVPAYPGAVARCIERDVTTAVATEDSTQRRSMLASLLSPERRLKPDDAQKRRIEEEIAKIPAEGFGGIGLGEIGRIGDGRGSSAPKVRMGATSVSGRLPPEVIQRIVRQNFGRFRLCYENGLKTKPDLAGRVTVRFVIGRDGSVQGAPADGGSDMPDKAVLSCVLRAFTGLSFPEPEGGIVTVVYPIMFSPGTPAPSASAPAP